MATITLYPDPNPEVTSVDGVAGRESVDQTFTNIRAGAGNFSNDTSVNSIDMKIVGSTTSQQYQGLYRAYYLFDASVLPSGTVITSATFSVWGNSTNTKANNMGSPDFHLAASSPSSNTAIANGDYGNVSTTSFGNITYANFTGSQYNDISLNASGITHIQTAVNGDGIIKFSGQLSWDILNDTTGLTWGSALTSAFRIVQADSAGTANDPKLVIEYVAAGDYSYIM